MSHPSAARPEEGHAAPMGRVNSVTAAFAVTFGQAPTAVFSAPGRLNLMGEHTDYNDGFALPFALPLRCYVAASPRTDGRIVAVSRQADDAVDVAAADVWPGTPQGWGAYAVGTWWGLRRVAPEATLVGGVSLLIDSDVPLGAGLASSAAIECATILAFDHLAGTHLAATQQGRRHLAEAAHLTENHMAGAPTGRLDQLASLLTPPGEAVLIDFADLSLSPVPSDLNKHGLRLLVADSGAPHALNGGEYARRRAECEDGLRALGLSSARALDDAALARLDAVATDGERLVPEASARRLRYVASENRRVLDAAEVLRAGHPEALGPLLNEGQASLREELEVSVPEIDALCTAALEAGALGAKMVGGGFGGSVIALVEDRHVDAVTQAMARTAGVAAGAVLDVAPSFPAGREA